jgi:hypothetical protein
MTTLHTIPGANYWSREPVTQMDLRIGAYEEISSADVPGMTDQLVAALPGLEEHRCSVGTRGGFITRLRRGTYAAHMIEHVALELQEMIGHHAGYGRTRGTRGIGEYTLAFEHVHAGVGLRAATLALQTVQQAFAGTLTTVKPAVAELRALAKTPPALRLHRQVLCGITGGTARDIAHDTLTTLGGTSIANNSALIVDVAPAYILQAGLPYSQSDIAIILDTTLTDVPEWYRDPERAARLVAVVADAVSPSGWVICPDDAPDVHSWAQKAGCRIVPFKQSDDPTERTHRAAQAAFTCLAQVSTPTTAHYDER